MRSSRKRIRIRSPEICSYGAFRRRLLLEHSIWYLVCVNSEVLIARCYLDGVIGFQHSHLMAHAVLRPGAVVYELLL